MLGVVIWIICGIAGWNLGEACERAKGALPSKPSFIWPCVFFGPAVLIVALLFTIKEATNKKGEPHD